MNNNESKAKSKSKLVSFLSQRKFRYGGYATILTAVVIAVVILLNIAIGAIESNWALTLDVTALNATDFDDATYDDFMKFVRDKKFDYTTESEKTLAELKKHAKTEGYLESIQADLDRLEKQLQADKENDLMKNRKDIEDLLRLEIVGRYYYQVGRIIASLEDDEDLKEAFDILLDQKRYQSLLKP